MPAIKQFLEIFNPLPGNHYLQVTTKVDATTTALYTLMREKEGEMRIAYYNEKETHSLQESYPEAKIQHIKNFAHPFRALPRDNDIVIFKDIFHLHANQELILKTAYTTLANTAELIIMQKKATMDIQALKELLERFEFRTPNEIDIFPEYDLIIAKKMHMWGNGL